MADLIIPRAHEICKAHHTLNLIDQMYGESLERGYDLSPQDIEDCELKLAEAEVLIKKANCLINEVHEKIYALRYGHD